MDDFLAQVRRQVEAERPHLRSLFDIMAGEARFARAWLDEDLRRLPKAAPVLEVGGGVFLLTCQLAREGFSVTAIEPTGAGFGSFEELGVIVLELAAREGAEPTIARCKAEDFRSDMQYALAFSVNVMEHIEAPDQAFARVSAVLSVGGSYRFLCPNYLFPYEPHFNIPTIGGKALTARLMRRRIEGSPNVDDPAGLWKSLNWITVPASSAHGSLRWVAWPAFSYQYPDVDAGACVERRRIRETARGLDGGSNRNAQEPGPVATCLIHSGGFPAHHGRSPDEEGLTCHK